MLNRKGQNIAEYSILIALVIAAAVAMQVYVKRGIQGRVADAVDTAPTTANEVGGKALQFNTRQYEPYYLQSSGDVYSGRTFNESTGKNVSINRTGINETTTRYEGATENVTFDNTYKDPDRP